MANFSAWKEYIQQPKFLRAFHGWMTAFWIPFTIFAFAVGWLKSVIFVSLASMVALFLGSFSSWQGARTEVKQDEQNPEVDVDVPKPTNTQL